MTYQIRLLSPSQTIAKPKTASNCLITFDIQLKTALTIVSDFTRHLQGIGFALTKG